jgi:mRNA deadenylase 3'-5' endonuclease subunit Ccr4
MKKVQPQNLSTNHNYLWRVNEDQNKHVASWRFKRVGAWPTTEVNPLNQEPKRNVYRLTSRFLQFQQNGSKLISISSLYHMITRPCCETTPMIRRTVKVNCRHRPELESKMNKIDLKRLKWSPAIARRNWPMKWPSCRMISISMLYRNSQRRNELCSELKD